MRKFFRKKMSGSQVPLSEKAYGKSRTLFIIEGGAANAIGTLASGVIVSGFLKFLGASDAINGIISGMPICAGVLQLFSPVVFRRMAKIKPVVTIFALVHRLLFSVMLSVPIFLSDSRARMTAFMILYVLGYTIGSFIGPSAANWLVSLVPGKIRGKYLAVKEGVALITMTLVSVLMGMAIDRMKASGHEELGYAICSLVILAFTIVNFTCLLNIDEPKAALSNNPVTIKSVLTVPLKDKVFRKILLLSVLWNFGLQIGGPYFSIYYYSVLGMDYTYIMLMSFLMSIIRTIAAQAWGRIADRKNWAFITKLSMAWLGLVHASFLFLNSDTVYSLFPILQMASGIGWGGVSISMFNMQFEYAPQENRTVYIAANAAVSNMSGFTAVLIASAVVGAAGDFRLYFRTVPVSIMQVLFVVSGLLILFTSLYIHRCIREKRSAE